MPAKVEEKELVVMQARFDELQAYFDESGSHWGAPVCVIAGYRGATSRWEVFEQRWRRALNEADLPEFHAKVFFARDEFGRRIPPYDKLSEKDREWFIGMLLDAIVSARLEAEGCAIDVPAFQSFNEHERRYLSGGIFRGTKGAWILSGKPSEAFYLPFQRVLMETVKGALDEATSIHFTFDQNNVLGPFMGELFATIKRRADELVHMRRLGEFTLGERVKNPPLQAADLLAHCGMQSRTHRILAKRLSGVYVA